MDSGRGRVWIDRKGSRLLTRREAIRIGLAGSALTWLGPSCQEHSNTPKPPKPPNAEPVYELMPGNSLYDDFDGHGNYQSYESRDLATAGGLYERIWVPGGGARAIDSALADPAPLSPAAVDGSGLLSGFAPVQNYILEISCGPKLTEMAWLNSPRAITFADFGSISADVMLSSRSTALHPNASLNFHTTIPEQPPGRSWWVSVGIHKDPGGTGALVIGQYLNLNLGIIQNDFLGPAALDEWRALRLDILTKADDPRLGDLDLRLDYYLDGMLKASRIPEDSAILIDPSRTGLGPHRSLIVSRDSYDGDAIGYFDNVHARYNNRIA